jgi:hypothetical protein
MFAPDTQQNIIVTLVLLVIHNYIALGYAAGLAVSTIFGLVKPSRSRILLMVGFATLLLSFEYSKHIQVSLLEQTKQSLITERYSSRLERVIALTINRATPLGLQIIGVLSVATGAGLELRNMAKRGYTTRK